MMKKIPILALAVAMPLVSAFADDGGCPVSGNTKGRENTEWSISYGFHHTDAKRGLPRVLLVGDSICNGYQAKVRDLTEGRCNVSYWISSYCVSRPEYMRMLETHLDDSEYAVIHFNNGLHSTMTETSVWAAALADAFRLIRRKQPRAKIIWAASTPLKSEEMNVKVRELNRAAEAVVRKVGGIATNDLYSFLDPFDREEHWSDMYHHKPSLRAKEADRVASVILSELPKKRSPFAMKLEHVAINVAEPVKMAAWWCENFGMETVYSGPAPVNCRFIRDFTGTMCIEFYNNPAKAPDYRSKNPLELHIAFECDDPEDEAKRLVAAGATLVVMEYVRGMTLAMMRDPWGVCFQLCKRPQPVLDPRPTY